MCRKIEKGVPAEKRKCLNPSCLKETDQFYPEGSAWQTCPYCLKDQANPNVKFESVNCSGVASGVCCGASAGNRKRRDAERNVSKD